VDQLTIKIPSIPENIRIVESFIDNANDFFAFSEDMYGNVMVSVTEAVNNAILHGNQSNASKHVTLSLHIEDKAFVKFVITDEGNGFDYNDLPDPTAPENIENLGGRGIFLMKQLCDELDFDNEGRTTNLSFNL